MAELDDLRSLLDSDGPFVTVTIPAPSRFADSDERFDIEVGNALSSVPDHVAGRDALASALAGATHGEGAGLVAVQSADGSTHIEFLADAVERSATVSALPRLAPIIEARQRTIAHVVVATDLAGADIAGYDGGDVVAEDHVDGDTEHIHRGRQGGWSQRRFQQRAENTWDENIDDVAEAVGDMVGQIDARLIAVTGPVRARTMLVERLEDGDVAVVEIEEGDDDAAAAAIVRSVDDVSATDTREAIERARESMATTEGVDPAHMGELLRDGRVATLLVHDHGDEWSDPDSAPFVDRCIRDALGSGADVRVVPNVSLLVDGVSAILRW